MRRTGKVFFKIFYAGLVWQDDEADEEYGFEYDIDYLAKRDAEPISLTLPLRKEPYKSRVLFPFFDGLIPEGWLLDITVKNWKLSPTDRMQLLLTVCKDCIGAVSVEPIEVV